MSGWQAKLKAAIASIFRRSGKKKSSVNADEHLDRTLVRRFSGRSLPAWSQVRHLNKVLTSPERKRVLIVLLLFIVSSCAFLTRMYFRATIAEPTHGGAYTEGLIGSPRFVNPILAPNNDVDRDISQLIFSGLMKVTSDGQLVPDLAQGFSISEDQKTYVFDLRENVTWHDGERLTAEDVVYTFEAIADPDFQSPLRPTFSGIVVSAIDQNSVKFVLEEPFAPFLASLTVGIIPRHIWYPIPAAQASLSSYMIKPVGTGPYEFESLTKDDRSGSIKLYTVKANQKFYNQRAYIDQINLKFYPDFFSGAEALQNQNIDGLSLLPKDTIDVSKLQKSHTVINLQLPQYTAIFFNPNNNPALSSIGVRQALSYAINRQKILEQALSGQGNIIDSPILPNAAGHDSDLAPYDYNTKTARELLTAAGWTSVDGSQYLTNADGEQLAVKITTVDQPENTATISLIQQDWEAIGIKTELEIISKNNIRREIIEPRNYQLLLFGQVVGQNNDPYPFWHSSQTENPGLNLSILANKDIDQALDDAHVADNQVTQVEAYKKFQEKLHDQAFAIFLYNPTYTYPVSNKVKGLDTLTRINIPAERFLNITQWYIKTHRVWPSQ